MDKSEINQLSLLGQLSKKDWKTILDVLNVYDPNDIMHVYPEMGKGVFVDAVQAVWRKVLKIVESQKKEFDTISELCDSVGMNYNFEVSQDWEGDGTCLQDRISVGYHTLVDLFGIPQEGDGHRTQVEWAIVFEDGEVATIYDWKENNKPVGFVGQWNLGGKSSVAPNRVKELIAEYMDSKLLV